MQLRHVALPDAARLAVHVAGGGRPLLLLHAFPLDHRMWEGQAPLAERLRLIVPDLRGFGASRDAGGPESIAQLADDMAALLDSLQVDEPVAVCGCSMGGYVAQHLAVRHPARVGAMILVDTKLEADTPEARATRADLAGKVRRIGTRIVAEAMVPKLLAPAPAQAAQSDRPRLVALLESLVESQEVDTICAALAALGDRPDMTEPAARIGVPTLLVVGAEDQITPPACLERAEAIIPDARLLIVPGAGHMVPLEAPAIFNDALERFLFDGALVG
jgi:pimeloyl-ACP methyl ester carboxylesterase